MKFGSVPIDASEGAMLGHALTVGGRRFRKAYRLAPPDVAFLKTAGVGEVIAAVLDPGDLDEDAAAARIADSLLSANIEAKPAATGRVNLHAGPAGVFTVDRTLIDAVNGIDPAITVATLPDFATVEAGQMVATVKIIPFAVPEAIVAAAQGMLAGREAFRVHPFAPLKVGLIQTSLPSVKPTVLDKTVRVTQARLARSRSTVVRETRTEHTAAAVAAALRELDHGTDMILVFGASALADFDDVIPAAIRLAEGCVLRAGMPVDPGNLLVLGRLGRKPVIGAPGCARSPMENGFDWVLDRLSAGLDLTSADIAGMGVGGLLMEIASRPQPREPATEPAGRVGVAAIVMAAGQSSRMGGSNKLLAHFGGEPLIRQTVERVAAAGIVEIVVVTGHEDGRIRQALAGSAASFAHNSGFAAGLSSSLRVGLGALSDRAAGAMIVLGDMPLVSAAALERMVAAFRQASGKAIVRATNEGRGGNPVILPRALFPEVQALEGDAGARHLVETSDLPVVEVEIGEAALTDVDTPEMLRRAGGVLQD